MGEREVATRELQRIGGEASFVVYVEDGRIVDAYFVSLAPIRGFERIVRGKNAVFAVNAAMRICGICHAAHGIASISAIENALGVSPPPNGRVIREVLGLLNRIQSHVLHLALMLSDILLPARAKSIFEKIIDLYNRVSNALAKVGGAPTHPPNIVIGGVEKVPDQGTIEYLTKELEGIRDLLGDILVEVLDESNWTPVVQALRERDLEHDSFLASHPFYGDIYSIDVSQIRTLRYEEWRRGNIPDEAKENTTLISLYGDQEVEAGPRARLRLFRGFSDASLWGIQIARLKEIELALERLFDLIDLIEPGRPGRPSRIYMEEGEGVGVFEAPRGTLIHWVKLSIDGSIVSYRIVVPTMFNVPWIEKAALGFPAEWADVIPRIFDPCIPCATHVVRVRGGGT